MLLEYVLTYLIVDYLCLFFAILIFTKITFDMGTNRELFYMRALIIVFCVYLVVDAVWALGVNGFLPMSPAAVGITESIAVLLMCGLSFCWFMFAENRIKARFMVNRRATLLSASLLIIVILLYATTGFTGLIFSVGPDGSFIPGSASLIPSAVFLFYTVSTTGHALYRFFKEKSHTMRRKYLTIAAFAFSPAACGVLDMIIHGMPVMAISVYAAIMLVFVSFQSSRINTDALTGLNNRRCAEEYIEEQLSQMSGKRQFGIFMADIDYFKAINDAHGHNEGDHALKIVADGIRQAVGDHNGLAARWGGDEFIIATYLKDDETPDMFETTIRTKIDAACESENLDYSILMSVGYTPLHRDESLIDALASVDRNLYTQKNSHHAALEQSQSAV